MNTGWILDGAWLRLKQGVESCTLPDLLWPVMVQSWKSGIPNPRNAKATWM